MKKHILEFIRRGLTACGFGPLVLAVLYLIMQKRTGTDILTVSQVCYGIFSLSALAFVAGGMNIVYQIERLPLMGAITLHGVVLYVSYLATYLINGWLEQGITPILIFSCIFMVSYLIIWLIIYSVVKKKTKQVNELLKKKQKSTKM